MTYALDSTGALGANLITGEVLTVNAGAPAINTLQKGLFYEKGLVLAYAATDGSSRNLVRGTDFELAFEILNVAPNNSVFAAIELIDQTLNGTITAQYQTLGGSWIVNMAAIIQTIRQTEHSPTLSYFALAPLDAIYVNGSTVPLQLTNFASIQQAQTAVPTGVMLGVTLRELPDSRKLTSIDGHTGDGQDHVAVPGVVYFLASDGTPLPKDTCQASYTYDGSGNLASTTLYYNGAVFVKTTVCNGAGKTVTETQFVRQ